jgi:small subunit ribosomal protein S16
MVKPFKFVVDREKAMKWLNNGALLSETAEGLLRREGIVQEYNVAKRNNKKAIASDASASAAKTA